MVRGKHKYFLVALLVLVFIWGGFQYWPVSVHVSGATPDESFSIQMPLKDKRRLEYFFRDVCFLNSWAYTLMGSKPMSVHQYRKPWAAVRYMLSHSEMKAILHDCFWPPNFYEICYLLNPQQLKTKLGWDTLSKYAYYFPNSRFAFYTNSSRDSDIVCLAIIDKKKLTQTIDRNFEDFQPILQGQKIEIGNLLEDKELFQFLRGVDHDGLIGTLLGYGRENAWLFYKYRQLDRAIWPLVSPWKELESDQLEQLNKKDISLTPWDISDLFYPPFACDPSSEETENLKRIYKEEREQIVKYYEGKDVVEATFSLLYREY